MPRQAPAQDRGPAKVLKLGKDKFELWPVPPMKSFQLSPLFAPALGRAGRQIAIAIKDSGFLESKEAESITLADIENLIVGGDEETKTPGADVLRELIVNQGPDLISALGETIGMMRPSDLGVLTRELLNECLVNGMPLYPMGNADDQKFNEVFARKPLAVWRVLFFAMQVNYADFSMAPADEEEKPARATPSPASNISGQSGPSGESSATKGSTGSPS